MNSNPWKMSRTQQPNRRTRLNFLAESQQINYFLQIIIHSNTARTLCAFCAYNLIVNKNLPNCCCYMKRPTMLRPMKRCKQRTNLWLGHSTWRIRFWFAWKATIVFRPQDGQNKAAGHIHLPGSFVGRAAWEVEISKSRAKWTRISAVWVLFFVFVHF
jgi:hypothetical protein